ncbi:MAG TPA: hypothetical protein VLL98_04750 [Rickettsiales bacterium]|nr:hypothetical protein [Rickettsiales bacterium]
MKFKQDIYTKNRGNYSEYLNLYCRKCGYKIAKYQKDGPGNLLRIYVDRITENNGLLNFEIDKKMICPNCERLLGLGYLYPKEKRPAYILFQDTIIKKPKNFIRHLYCIFLSLFKNNVK